MYCPECGAKQNKKSRFCNVCGAGLTEKEKKKKAADGVEAIELECPNCSAQMEMGEDKHSMICPFCGTRMHLEESDEVKKERIRNETLRINHEATLAYERERDERERNEEESRPPVKTKGTFIWALVFSMFAVVDASNRLWISSAVAFVQAILTYFVWFCKKRHLLRRRQGLFTILKILPFVLIIVYGLAGNVDERMKDDAQLNAKRTERLAEGESTYVWPGTQTASLIPEPVSEKGKILKSTERKLELEVYHVEKNDYTDYIKQCKAAGFTYYESADETLFEADNEDHYHLELTWNADSKTFNTMSISLEAPYAMKEIKWPSTKCTDPLPDPPSLVGNIRAAEDHQALIYLADVSKEQYQAFIDACIAKGFEENFSSAKLCMMTYPGEENRILALRLQNWDVMQILVYIDDEK